MTAQDAFGNVVYFETLPSPSFLNRLTLNDRTNVLLGEISADGALNFNSGSYEPGLISTSPYQSEISVCKFNASTEIRHVNPLTGAMSIFIPSATVGFGPRAMRVDDTGRVIVVANGRAKRFLANGSLDVDWNPISPTLFGDAIAIDPGGRYFYDYIKGMSTFFGLGTSLVDRYDIDTQTKTASFITITLTGGSITAGNPAFVVHNDGSIFLVREDFTGTISSGTTVRHFTARRFDNTGALITTYDLVADVPPNSSSRFQNLIEQNCSSSATSGATDKFSGTDGNLWFFVRHSSSTPFPGNYKWLIKLDLDTAIATSFQNRTTLDASAISPIATIRTGQGFPGFALYPTAGGAAIYGPAFTL